MKYRIKTPEVENAVRGMFTTQEAFEKKLNAWSEHHFKNHPHHICIKIVANSAESITGYTCELYVATSDIEEVIEYDSKVWNPFPQVQPPKKGWYRIESKDWHGVDYKQAFYWDGGVWRYEPYGGSISETLTPIIKFKPWDDEEDKE